MNKPNRSTCARCDRPAFALMYFTNLCLLHVRAEQMRRGARYGEKAIPPREVIESLLNAALASGMKCPSCGRTMNWLKKDGQSTVITLQHDRDGGFRAICFGCNVRHQFHPNDTFYSLPAGHKRCQACKNNKPTADFYSPSRANCRQCERTASLRRYHTKKRGQQT